MTPVTLIKLINGTYHLLRNLFISFFCECVCVCVMGGAQGEGGKKGENGVCEDSVTLYQPFA